MRFLCKDCWIAHEPATLLARCKQCEANTQIDRRDPLQSKAASVSSTPLVCRIHPSEPLDIYCGTCEKPVPPRTVVGERSIVALLGDTASGKTSFLWVLSERLRQPNGAGGVYIRQALGNSDEQMMSAVRGIFEDGRMRATPSTDADVRNYAWELANGAHATTVIAFHDAAGEVWNGLGDLSRREYARFYRYLDLTGSVLFAIDGARVIEALDVETRRGVASPQLRAAQLHEIAIIDTVSRRMRARGERIPAAVVITKADVFWDRPEWKLFQPGSGATEEALANATRELLMKAGRHSLVSAIEEVFAPVRYFTVSAFGHAPQVPLKSIRDASVVNEETLRLDQLRQRTSVLFRGRGRCATVMSLV